MGASVPRFAPDAFQPLLHALLENDIVFHNHGHADVVGDHGSPNVGVAQVAPNRPQRLNGLRSLLLPAS
jgi:hypothetical protein